MIVVSAASVTERAGAKLILAKIKGLFPRLRLKESDGGYDGQDFIKWMQDTYHWVWKIVKRDNDVKGFKVLPWRWKRGAYFRGCWDVTGALCIDYEALPAS